LISTSASVLDPKESQGQYPEEVAMLEVGFLPAVMAKICLIHFLNEKIHLNFGTCLPPLLLLSDADKTTLDMEKSSFRIFLGYIDICHTF
jgi:hypothetical protein